MKTVYEYVKENYPIGQLVQMFKEVDSDRIPENASCRKVADKIDQKVKNQEILCSCWGGFYVTSLIPIITEILAREFIDNYNTKCV
jgi:hypothetical protein